MLVLDQESKKTFHQTVIAIEPGLYTSLKQSQFNNENDIDELQKGKHNFLFQIYPNKLAKSLSSKSTFIQIQCTAHISSKPYLPHKNYTFDSSLLALLLSIHIFIGLSPIKFFSRFVLESQLVRSNKEFYLFYLYIFFQRRNNYPWMVNMCLPAVYISW